MKKWALITAGLSAVLFNFHETHAQSAASSNITLNGTVNQYCALPPPSSSTGAGTMNVSGGSDAIINFQAQDFTDSGTGLHHSVTQSITYPQAMCNYSAFLSLKSTNSGMKPNATAPANFSGVVNYTATASWGAGGTPATLTTGASQTKTSTPFPPTIGNLVVNIVTANTTAPLIGNGTPYTDTLVLQIGPAL